MAKKYHPNSFTEQQLRQGCARCIDKVKGLLNSALILLDHKESQQYSLGLYIYAIEEFGKAIMLKRQVDGKRAAYKIPNFIFENHEAKLLEGLKNMPAACGAILRGIRITTSSNKALRIKIDSDREIIRGANTTGNFFDTTNTPNCKRDIILLKTGCFYINWDKRNNTWNYEVATDTSQLKDKIELFRDALNKFKCIQLNKL
jgi:AbiV family abortive infection protein